MANLKKFSDMKDIGHLCKHYERSVSSGNYSNSEIDFSKIHLDRKSNLAPDRGKQTEYIKEQIEKIRHGKTIRKNAVRMCCWVIDFPKTLSPEKQDIFFRTAYDFLIERYGTKSGLGEDVCISSYIHYSESTAHMHFAFIPILQEKNGTQKLCAKELVDRSDLRTFHKDLAKIMEEKQICARSDILNGATQRDSSGRALSVKELKRKREIDRERARTQAINRWTNKETIYDRERSRW